MIIRPITIVSVGLTTLFLLFTTPVGAAQRNCTAAEKAEANARLMAIHGDEALKAALVKHHCLSAFIPERMTGKGASNEELLVQDGYIMWHDGDLRTVLWTTHKLVGSEVVDGDGKDRINCFRPDPRRERDRSAGRMGSRNQEVCVAISSHYYKNFIRKEGNQWLSISFMIENHNGPHGTGWDAVKPHVLDAIES